VLFLNLSLGRLLPLGDWYSFRMRTWPLGYLTSEGILKAAAPGLKPDIDRRSANLPLPMGYLVVQVDYEDVWFHRAVMAVRIVCMYVDDLLVRQETDDDRGA